MITPMPSSFAHLLEPPGLEEADGGFERMAAFYAARARGGVAEAVELDAQRAIAEAWKLALAA